MSVSPINISQRPTTPTQIKTTLKDVKTIPLPIIDSTSFSPTSSKTLSSQQASLEIKNKELFDLVKAAFEEDRESAIISVFKTLIDEIKAGHTDGVTELLKIALEFTETSSPKVD